MKYSFIYSFFTAIILFTSCTGDFLDINDDPNQPGKVELPKLLSGTQKNVGYAFSSGISSDIIGDSYSSIGSILPSCIFHTSSREVDNYGISSDYPSLTNTWLHGYVYCLTNLDAIISEGEATDNRQYSGVAKIMKVYVFSHLVDLWGDIPYSEFNVKGLYQPKADKGEDIYNSLLNLIDDAVADLNNENSANLIPINNADLFYNGDLRMWIKVANTLKLKMLVNSRKAKSDINNWSEKLEKLLAENNFIENDEDWQFEHTLKDNPDERNYSYVIDYESGQQTFFISPWLYEIMGGLTHNAKNNPFESIEDPRMPYYWVNQLEYEDSEAENMTDYRDGRFVSLFFGSASAYSGANQRKSSSYLGIYPCGGHFDFGNGVYCDKTVGTGVAPDKMLQAYSVPFLKAELYLTEAISGDAKAALKEGIEKSIYHVNQVSQRAAKDGVKVPSIADADIESFVTKIIKKFDAASSEDKLNMVMSQKWIANFFNSVEAYTDMRRTGYPEILAKGTRNAISPYKPNHEGESGPANIPLKIINDFPRAMWYPFMEVSRNPNISNKDRDLSESLVFWDK